MPSIKCGHCQNTHDSVFKVRVCAATTGAHNEMVEEQQAAWKQEPIRVGGRGYGKVYESIKRVGERVPEGRYALVIAGSTSFYRVSKPTDGKWAGYVFVSKLLGGLLQPLRGPSALEALELIAAAPQEAMLRYGREIGQCGHCGRTLTNEESRARGIGPVCAESFV